MSMPHVCKCGICGQQMNWLGLDFAKPGTDKSMFWCTKHGPIDTPGECLKCRAELETSAKCEHDFTFTENKDAGWCTKCRVEYDGEQHGPALNTAPALPEHLQDEAPPQGQCNKCGRKTWNLSAKGKPCNMPQPDGSYCNGTL
jgi:hypothetical protein